MMGVLADLPVFPKPRCLGGIPPHPPAWLSVCGKAQNSSCLWVLMFCAAPTDKQGWLLHPITKPVKITIETNLCTCYHWK